MSKSLGNVLDPFAVIERFGADALRFYLLRDVPFGQDGSVSTAAFELRYESELANELGNLASRTIAMLARYRDGALAARASCDPLLAADFAGLPRARRAAHRPRRADARARGDLAARAAPEPLRRGAGAVEARQGRRRAPRSSTACCARSPRVCARSRCCCGPTCPHSAERLLAALGGAGARRYACAELGRRAHRARARRSSRCSPRTPRDVERESTRTPTSTCATPPRRASSSPPPRRRASRRMLTVGHRRRLVPRRAGGGRGLPAGLRGDRPPPQRGAGLRRRRPGRAARAGRARALRGDRRDGPGLLPRRRAARRPGAGVRGADRARARDRQAARDPHARRRAGDARAARREADGRERGDALLLDARAARGVPGARLCDLVRGQRHLQERGRARGGRRAGARGARCWSRPTRPT